MRKPSLDKIIEANKNKTGHIPNKGNISLSTNGWLNQYKMGGGMFPEYHSYAPPRLQGGGSGDAAVLQQQKNGESIGWLDKYQNAGQVVNNFGLANPRDLARQNMGSNESTSSGLYIAIFPSKKLVGCFSFSIIVLMIFIIIYEKKTNK